MLQLHHLHLQLLFLLVLHALLVLRTLNLLLSQVVLLLQVHDQLVLTPDHFVLSFDIVQLLVDFAVELPVSFLKEVILFVDLVLELVYLVVFLYF